MSPQFTVPQFIDVEDKIIGPITVKQFIMGIGAGLLFFLAYKFADTALFIIQALLILGIYILIAFVKFNGQPFYLFALSVIRSILRPSLRAWMKGSAPVAQAKQAKKESDSSSISIIPAKPHPRTSTLSSLALLVDTGGKYRPEEIIKKTIDN